MYIHPFTPRIPLDINISTIATQLPRKAKESESADKNHIDDSEVPIAEPEKETDPINSPFEYVFDP
jgi:hypothetical protein